MPNKKAKPYPTEFKESAVKLAIESTNPIVQTAKELGINVNIIHTWIKQYSKTKDTASKQEREVFFIRKGGNFF